LTEEEHARHIGVDTKYTCPTCGKAQSWGGVFNGVARRKYIYRDDKDTYQAIRKAATGFRHGHAIFAEIRETAGWDVTTTALRYLRSAILDVLGLSQGTRDLLMTADALDPSPFTHRVSGTFTGAVDDATRLGKPGQRFPFARRLSEIVEVDTNEKKETRLVRRDRVQIDKADDVDFHPEAYWIMGGRNGDGSIQIEVVDGVGGDASQEAPG
jgi:hypothetical protein